MAGSRAWFLKIDSVQISVVCVCVCVPAPKLQIASGMMGHDMNPIWLAKQVIQCLYDSYIQYH